MNAATWKRNGLMMGLFISAAMLVATLAAGDPPDFAMQEVIGYGSMALSTIFIVLGIRAAKASAGGTISLGGALKVGFLIAAIAGLIVGIYTAIHIAWVDPAYTDNYIAYQQEQLVASGATPEVIAEEMAAIEDWRGLLESPFAQGVILALTVILIGGVVALVTALILRSRE